MNVVAAETNVPETQANAAPATVAPSPVRREPPSAQDRAEYRAVDLAAARGVVGIMMAIFTAALIGYSFIAWWVWTH